MENENGCKTLTFSGDLSIGRSVEIRDELAQALALNCHLLIDCENASSVDASFIQILFAARASASFRGVDLRVKAGRHEALSTALKAGGFIQDGPLPDDKLWLGE